MGAVFLAQAVTAMIPPVVAVPYDEATWPSSYHCKVLTDNLELIEFRMNLKGSEAVLDRNVLPIVAGKPIALEWMLRAPKRGDKYARGMQAVRGTNYRFYVIQSGVPDRAITSLQIEAGKTDRPESERGPLASGFCSVFPNDTKRGRTQ